MTAGIEYWRLLNAVHLVLASIYDEVPSTYHETWTWICFEGKYRSRMSDTRIKDLSIFWGVLSKSKTGVRIFSICSRCSGQGDQQDILNCIFLIWRFVMYRTVQKWLSTCTVSVICVFTVEFVFILLDMAIVVQNKISKYDKEARLRKLGRVLGEDSSRVSTARWTRIPRESFKLLIDVHELAKGKTHGSAALNKFEFGGILRFAHNWHE